MSCGTTDYLFAGYMGFRSLRGSIGSESELVFSDALKHVLVRSIIGLTYPKEEWYSGKRSETVSLLVWLKKVKLAFKVSRSLYLTFRG
jgi:hypothetical protein